MTIRVQDLTKLYRRVTPGDQLRTLKSALLSGSLIQDLQPDGTARQFTESAPRIRWSRLPGGEGARLVYARAEMSVGARAATESTGTAASQAARTAATSPRTMIVV